MQFLFTLLSRLGPIDLDALMNYMSVAAPITAGLEQRIQFVNKHSMH